MQHHGKPGLVRQRRKVGAIAGAQEREVEHRCRTGARALGRHSADLLLAALDPFHHPVEWHRLRPVLGEQPDHPLVDREPHAIELLRQVQGIGGLAGAG